MLDVQQFVQFYSCLGALHGNFIWNLAISISNIIPKLQAVPFGELSFGSTTSGHFLMDYQLTPKSGECCVFSQARPDCLAGINDQQRKKKDAITFEAHVVAIIPHPSPH